MKTRIIAATLAVLLAVAGSVFLILYVRKVEANAPAAGAATVDVLVAVGPIATGTSADGLNALVTTKALPVDAVLPNGVTDLDQLGGQVALIPLEPGEQLLSSKFGPAAEIPTSTPPTVLPTFQTLTLLLRPEQALGGQLKAGDTVGVFVSLDEPKPGLTHLIASNVIVTAVEPSVPRSVSPPSTGDESEAISTESTQPVPVDPTESLLVTLATTGVIAEKVVFGAEHGSIWLSNQPSTVDNTGVQIIDGIKVYK